MSTFPFLHKHSSPTWFITNQYPHSLGKSAECWDTWGMWDGQVGYQTRWDCVVWRWWTSWPKTLKLGLTEDLLGSMLVTLHHMSMAETLSVLRWETSPMDHHVHTFWNTWLRNKLNGYCAYVRLVMLYEAEKWPTIKELKRMISKSRVQSAEMYKVCERDN